MAIQKAVKEKPAPPVSSLNLALGFRAGAKMANQADRAAGRSRPRMIARKRQAARISSPPPAARRERHKGSCRGRHLNQAWVKTVWAKTAWATMAWRRLAASHCAGARAFASYISGHLFWAWPFWLPRWAPML